MHKVIPVSLVAVTLAMSCTPTSEPLAPRQGRASVSQAGPAIVLQSPPRHRVTAPMAGEPAAAALKETRLVASSSCDELKAQAYKHIAKMRAELKLRLKAWRATQSNCWQKFNEGKMWGDPMGGGDPLGSGHMWGDDIGMSYGAGGLGLSGIGTGGGGRGEGIGLGSIGTIGHGAGKRQPRKAAMASGTNNQIASVDEADIVKTDGSYVYFAANGALRIVEAMNPRVLSVTRVPGVVRNLFIKGDRAVLYSSSDTPARPCKYGYGCRFAGDGTSTRISVLNIANRQHPKLMRTIEMSGSLMASRRIGSAVHTVVADGANAMPHYPLWPSGVPVCGTAEDVVVKKLEKLRRDNEDKIFASIATMPTMKDNGVTQSLCDGALQGPLGNGRAFTTVMSFDLERDQQPAKATMIRSQPGAVFASANALYLSVVQQKKRTKSWYSFYSSVDEVSEVHKLRISGKAAKTAYVGSGLVPGHVLNQFSMDEHNGYLRIATTRGWVPEPKVRSVVSVLAENANGNLVRVGAVDQIAPGEDIRSVRFEGNRGYVVTFKKTDPLFVLDLAHPAKPRILGELKIPGFSTYMHRIDDGHLLSIGFDAEERGNFALFDGIILQLFDVRHPTRPKLIHKTKIGRRGSSSEAATDHLAFNYMGERGLLAVPMTECSGESRRALSKLSFSGLDVYRVSVTDGFERLGRIDHGRAGANCNTWWSDATSHVKRSLFLDELVYSIAMDKVKVARLGSFGKGVKTLSLLP